MAESASKYVKAGVNIAKGNQAVKKIKEMVKQMGVKEIGKFSGFFPLKQKLNKPVLVSSADGVGTKLIVAFKMGKHNTVGKDLVNHCVNDILVYGAKPLFFLDYIATGKLEPDIVSSIVSGILDGCMENEFILLPVHPIIISLGNLAITDMEDHWRRKEKLLSECLSMLCSMPKHYVTMWNFPLRMPAEQISVILQKLVRQLSKPERPRLISPIRQVIPCL